MKKEPNIDETIYKIEQMLEDRRRIMHYVHAGTLMDVLALLKESRNQKCNRCEYYEGVRNIQGHAPRSFWNIGGVLWNDYCSRFKIEQAKSEL